MSVYDNPKHFWRYWVLPKLVWLPISIFVIVIVNCSTR